MDGAESYHCSAALRGQGTIITMTSEEDKYCTRTDCGILWEGGGGVGGSLKKKEEGGGDLATSFPTYPEEKCIIILFHTRLGSKAAKISL